MNQESDNSERITEVTQVLMRNSIIVILCAILIVLIFIGLINWVNSHFSGAEWAGLLKISLAATGILVMAYLGSRLIGRQLSELEKLSKTRKNFIDMS
jgi:amino acid transporter